MPPTPTVLAPKNTGHIGPMRWTVLPKHPNPKRAKEGWLAICVDCPARPEVLVKIVSVMAGWHIEEILALIKGDVEGCGMDSDSIDVQFDVPRLA